YPFQIEPRHLRFPPGPAGECKLHLQCLEIDHAHLHPYPRFKKVRLSRFVLQMFLRLRPGSASFCTATTGGQAMVERVTTVAFQGIEARAVDVQVQVAPGLPAFSVVGLADKAVSEARERVRSALIASGLALPARRITVNLAP